MKPSRKVQIESGEFMECLPVIFHAGLDIACDSCSVEMKFFEKLPTLTGLEAYKATVHVLNSFMKILPIIAGGTVTAQFRVDNESLDSFWVKIHASNEDVGRTLTFSLGTGGAA